MGRDRHQKPVSVNDECLSRGLGSLLNSFLNPSVKKFRRSSAYVPQASGLIDLCSQVDTV